MEILTSKCSDRFMEHVQRRRDQEAVRWYVLTLPTAGGGRDKISPSKGLAAELSRRERRGEHETAPAVQLRVRPGLGERDLPPEAYASPV